MSEGPPPSPEDIGPPPRRRRAVLVGMLSGLLVLVLAGAATAFFLLRGTGEQLLRAVPADADVVVTAYLDPSASQKVHLHRLLSRFPAVGDEQAVRERIDELIDEAFAEIGLTHEDLAWVGSQVLVWGSLDGEGDGRGSLLVQVDDRAAAEAAIARIEDAIADDGGSMAERDHGGTAVTVVEGEGAWALTDTILFIGTDATAVTSGLDAMAGDAPSVEDEARFAETSATLPEDRLALLYLDLEGLLDGLAATAEVDPADIPVSSATQMAMTLSASDDGLVFDAVTVSDPSSMDPELRAALDAEPGPNAALDAVTSDAVFLLGASGVDASMKASLAALDEEDPELAAELEELGLAGPGGLLESLTGDLSLSVQPAQRQPVDAVLALGVRDPAAATRAIRRLFTAVMPEARMEPILRSGDVLIYAVGGTPLPLMWAVSDDLAYLGTTPDRVAESIQAEFEGSGIATNERYAEATDLVETSDSVMYADVRAILDLWQDSLSGSDAAAFDEDIEPYLSPIDRFVGGGSGDATTQSARFVILIP